MKHMFDIEIAQKYGVNAAIILENIGYWVARNEANGENFHDGTYWTYNSRKAFCELFPYLTDRQIRTALQKLVDEGVIITGNYNDTAYDRTLWYALTDAGRHLLGMEIAHPAKMSNAFDKSDNIESAEMSNGICGNVKSLNTIEYQDNISDINPDINALEKHNAHACVREEDVEDREESSKDIKHDTKAANALFERLWNAYPNKKGKGQVSEKTKRKLLDIGEEQMLRCIGRYESDLNRDSWRQPQYGSTFFTSGYVDYLDANYSPPPPRPAASPTRRPNRFNNFESRSDDEKEIERQLLEAQHKRYVALGLTDDQDEEGGP